MTAMVLAPYRANLGRDLAQVPYQVLQLVFCAVGRKIGDLGFEGNYQVGAGFGNRSAKRKNLAGVTPPVEWKLGGIGVQPHAQQRPVLALGAAQLFDESHAAL
jgi:hypothetical protein